MRNQAICWVSRTRTRTHSRICVPFEQEEKRCAMLTVAQATRLLISIVEKSERYNLVRDSLHFIARHHPRNAHTRQPSKSGGSIEEGHLIPRCTSYPSGCRLVLFGIANTSLGWLYKPRSRRQRPVWRSREAPESYLRASLRRSSP